jgi:hypothetical protein
VTYAIEGVGGSPMARLQSGGTDIRWVRLDAHGLGPVCLFVPSPEGDGEREPVLDLELLVVNTSPPQTTGTRTVSTWAFSQPFFWHLYVATGAAGKGRGREREAECLTVR